MGIRTGSWWPGSIPCRPCKRCWRSGSAGGRSRNRICRLVPWGFYGVVCASELAQHLAYVQQIKVATKSLKVAPKSLKVALRQLKVATKEIKVVHREIKVTKGSFFMALGKSRSFKFGMRSAELEDKRCSLWLAALAREVRGGMCWEVPGALPQAVLLRAFSAGVLPDGSSWGIANSQ